MIINNILLSLLYLTIGVVLGRVFTRAAERKNTYDPDAVIWTSADAILIGVAVTLLWPIVLAFIAIFKFAFYVFYTTNRDTTESK